MLGRVNKVFYVLKMKSKINLLLYSILIFLFSCTNSAGIYEDRLIKLKDAEKELSILFIAKQIEYFPNTTVATELKLSSRAGCSRDIYYDKSDFRRCISNLAIKKFESKNSIELSIEFLYSFQNICDLKKIIMFENSFSSGEINLCELN